MTKVEDENETVLIELTRNELDYLKCALASNRQETFGAFGRRFMESFTQDKFAYRWRHYLEERYGRNITAIESLAVKLARY